LLTPWYFIQLFTTAKSFKSNPIIGNKFLNIIGLHVLRLITAHTIMKFRMMCLSRDIPKSLREQYYEDGYMLIENIANENDFEEIFKETKEIRSEIRECIQGNTLTHRVHLDKFNLTQSRAINRLITRKDVVKLFKFGSGKNHLPISHIQVIKSNYVKGKSDPQKNLHSDAFHPTMKYWFFLQDVGHNMAPFTYVKGSNKLTFKRLKWEYQKSINMDKEKTSYSKSGSFRVSEDELKSLDLPQAREVCVSKNTLVIVNTFGFHRRGDTDKKSTRSEIWGMSRSNPFNPFVGFDFKFFHALNNWGLRKIREVKDQEALKQGRHSSWHVINTKNLYEEENKF
jgi:hypothetical protein